MTVHSASKAPATTNTALSAALAAAKEAGRLHQQASDAHDIAHERVIAAEPSMEAIKEVWASVPPPAELVLDANARDEQRYDIIMIRRYADGREVSTEIPWKPADPVLLTTERQIEERHPDDPAAREAALKALQSWEAAKAAAVAARWPGYAELDALDDAAEKEWEAALDLLEDRLTTLLQTPVQSIEEAHAKLHAFLQLNADLYAGKRQWKGRHRGDMTRFVEAERAQEALSIVSRDIASLAQGVDQDRARRRRLIAAGVDSLVEAA